MATVPRHDPGGAQFVHNRYSTAGFVDYGDDDQNDYGEGPSTNASRMARSLPASPTSATSLSGSGGRAGSHGVSPPPASNFESTMAREVASHPHSGARVPDNYISPTYPPQPSYSKERGAEGYRDDVGHTDADEDTADYNIDSDLRLRTTRTAASVIAESIRSEQRAERRKTRRRFWRRSRSKRTAEKIPKSQSEKPPEHPDAQVQGERRAVHVNIPLPPAPGLNNHQYLDPKGEPAVRFVRNKVRTTKYTPLTFIPKNLYEQFRRSVIIPMLFCYIPIFDSQTGAISMLPLVFIVTVTAIKDGVEDYRRSLIDEEVNTSAGTKLGGSWRNVNQPMDPREWWEKLLNLNPPGTVSKGVRRLREREANEMRRELTEHGFGPGSERGPGTRGGVTSYESSSTSVDYSRRLEDIQSVDSHSYPPSVGDPSLTSLAALPPKASLGDMSKSGTVASTAMLVPGGAGAGGTGGYASSVASQITLTGQSTGAINYGRRASGGARWERTLWKKLEVGDIVLLRDNDQVPADIVVLSTSDPDGMCYLETKNLDGETNLKPRKSVHATSSIQTEDDIERCSFVLDSEPPHANLYVYRGTCRFNDPVTGQSRQEPVGINELLLRGCSLRNTDWVVGLVVFTGADTKIMLNGGDTPSKRSKIELETNFNVIVNFGVLVAMCTIAAILSGIDDGEKDTSMSIFEHGVDASSNSAVNALVTFGACLIAFQNIVPISLYISIEIVKTIQAYFISQDIDMYYKPYDTPCVPKNWNISDDLGQIEYIFSDKTGTLTQNVMEFQKCSVNGVRYGEGISEAERGAAKRSAVGGKTLDNDLATLDPFELAERLSALKTQMISIMERSFKNRYRQTDKLTLISPKLAQDVSERDSVQRQAIVNFFRALALCHSVLAERKDHASDPFKPQSTGVMLNYKAESPDEAALVAAARDVGFPFVNKTKDFMEIEVMGQPERYTLLKVLEFNSTRKRMSVIVRTSDGRIVLYCKGADSVIYERLRTDHEPQLKERTHADMEAFANGGLRTLCIAFKELSDEDFMTWERVFDAAASSTGNREEEIDKAQELIEKDLTILGATALEDKLQEGVPEAIDTLHHAGIKLWILTGDKLQTAIEIGYSCNLLKNDMDVMILSADSPEQTRNQIEAGLNKIASVLGPPSGKKIERGFVPGAQAAFAIVIDGDTLRHALSPELKPLFLSLGTQCETVVCCRVSPAQKALTVKLVKEGRNAMTLSIGDGANDVAMIQEANIGCGLFGLEGSQAAMSADYAFGQFRFLTKLLLVHGRWSYQRIADMHSNFFYKNVIWTLAMFWYLFYNSFDATYLYQYTFVLLYNLVFTSLPVIILGAFDQDVHARAALAFPQLYIRGIRGLEYTRWKFWMYMLDGLYQSVVVFFVPYAVWTSGLAISWNGKDIDSVSDFGTTVAVAAIFAANTYVGINTNYWTVITWLVVVGSSVVMLLWIVVYSFFFSSDFIDEVVILFGELTFWTTVVFSIVFALFPHFVSKFFKSAYMPLDKDLVREMWVLGNLKDRLGIRHRKDIKHSANADNRNLESAPMFTAQHDRSESEMSQRYVPTSSERSLAMDAIREETYDSLRSDADYPAPVSSVPFLGGIAPPSPSASSTATPLQTSLLLPPRSRADIPSYYSASEIRIPSPLPQPIYRYPDGQIATAPPSRAPSLARTDGNHTPSATLHPPEPQGPHSSEVYEMRVRSPQQSLGVRSASDSSFVSGQSFWTAEDEEEDASTLYISPSPAPPEESAAYADERQLSPQSWQGGVAL
ncbi:phospholipid-translocating P-type ATPase [Fistulina hepatica ATCC 64428]|uniref:Phospholipid-transporting ATPase n=1 Tax=Fistulina hepatica ATCC 64428 TaxID=1128425 RepID=A0A0D7AAI2_9AGAR|nr:phospholipid-translocating P-type ATPase [Fistulina hepatica ATCC 64428]